MRGARSWPARAGLIALWLLAPLGWGLTAAWVPEGGAAARGRLEEAVEAYSRGAHGRAADLYGEAAALGADSADLWHGLGCAYQQLGDLPRARLAWERALSRVPRSRAVARNLEQVERALDLGPEAGRPARIFGMFTEGELTLAWIVLSGGGLGLALPPRGLGRARARAALLSGGIGLAVGVGLGIRLLALERSPWAVVMAPVPPLRAGPAATAEEVGQAPPGALVRVQELSGGWRRVLSASGAEGWLRREQIELIEARLQASPLEKGGSR